MVSVFLAFFLLFSLILISNNLLIYAVKQKYVNIYKIRALISEYFRNRQNKAIEIGLVDFSLIGGIIFEDLRISSEEDFSNNRIFLKSERIEIRLQKVFSTAPEVKKVVFSNAHITLNAGDSDVDRLFDFLKEVYVPEVEFTDLYVTVKDGKDILLDTKYPITLVLKRKDRAFQVEYNDSFLKPFRTFHGTGTADTENKSVSLVSRFEKYSLVNFPGILVKILHTEASSGQTEGFLKLDYSQENIKMEGDINFLDIDTDDSQDNPIQLSGFYFNTKFSFFRDQEDRKAPESYFNRKVSNPNFFLIENVFTSKKNLKRKLYQFESSNLKNLSKIFSLPEGKTVSGKAKLNLIAEETGKNPAWTSLDGNLSLENFSFRSNQPSFSADISKAVITVNPEGEISSKMSGRFFDREFTLENSGTVNLGYDSAKDRTYFSGQLNMGVNVRKFILKDIFSLIESAYSSVQDNIRERQEKMLPEAYITDSRIYQIFLDKLNYNLTFDIENAAMSETSPPWGNFILTAKMSKGVLDTALQLKTPAGTDTEAKLSLNGQFDKKSPYFDVRAHTKHFPWKEKVYTFCGAEFFSDEVNLDFGMVTSGNNFSDFTLKRSVTAEFSFNKSSYRQSDLTDTFRWSEILGSESGFQVKGGMNGYAQESFVRNLEFISDSWSWKGFGNSTKTGYTFSGWGANSGKSQNFTVNREKGKCVLQKK